MSTYLALHVHVVFATKRRESTLADAWRDDLHAYLGGVARGLGTVPLAVGGVGDHVHLLLGLRATHAIADVVRELKKASSAWARDRAGGFAWQEGYAALSVGPEGVDAVVRYVHDQERHHRERSSRDELRELLAEAGVPIDERYFD